jgi:hypothetical protein
MAASSSFASLITDKEMNMKKYLDPHVVTRSKKALVHDPNPRNDPKVQDGYDGYKMPNPEDEQKRQERERQKKAGEELDKQQEERKKQEQAKNDENVVGTEAWNEKHRNGY